MKCPKCGSALPENVNFCGNCGEKVETTIQIEELQITVKESVDPKETFSKPPTEEQELAPSSAKKSPKGFNKFCIVSLIVASVIFIISFFSILFSVLSVQIFNSISDSNPFSEAFSKAVTPYTSTYCNEKNVYDVENDFSKAGFTNITLEPLEDLDVSQTDMVGTVRSVFINGETNFEGNQKYKGKVKVIIQYHSYKSIPIPISAEDTATMDTASILKTFEDAGFISLSTDEVFDLDPDATTAEFENEVQVGYLTHYEKGHRVPLDTEIKVITHRPYEKYTLNLSIDFVANLIFSKYNVEMTIGNNEEPLNHGADGEFSYRLEKGRYTLKFTKSDSSNVSGSATIDLTGDTNASYRITCNSDYIEVKTLYIENKGTIGENQAMVPMSGTNCQYKDYKEIESAFRDAGFTNISTEILYDIVWGITEEGEVKQVSINGNSDFSRGSVFDKDAAIIITYHMKQSDDPNNKVDTDFNTDTESKPENLTINNCPELAAILSNKAEIDESYSAFAKKYKGKVIEFDGRIDYCTKHGSYTTRFDYLVSAGNYNPNSQIGPTFKFENVNYYDLNTNLDTVSVGLNVHIVAEVVSFDNNSGLFYLDPISVTSR